MLYLVLEKVSFNQALGGNYMSIGSFLSEDLKQQFCEKFLEGLSSFVGNVFGRQTSDVINSFRKDGRFEKSFSTALNIAIERFFNEYQDTEIIAAIKKDKDFLSREPVREILLTLIKRPSTWDLTENDYLVKQFSDVIPSKNQDNMSRAIIFLLRCIVEELWTLPYTEEIRDIYNLQFSKITADASVKSLSIAEKQYNSLIKLCDYIRGLSLDSAQLSPIKQKQYPINNLPQPDYIEFIGRKEEKEFLHKALAADERTWQILIYGIGGVGKSALALEIALEYCRNYKKVNPKDRFDAVIWISAKGEMLTHTGKKAYEIPGIKARTLHEIYSIISQTVKFEDKYGLRKGQLIKRILTEHRILLLIDGMEEMRDKKNRINDFLKALPWPSKAIITSRFWMETGAVEKIKLLGLNQEEARKMIKKESEKNKITLDRNKQDKLIERTSGLPLPIKLSIARIGDGLTFESVYNWLGNYDNLKSDSLTQYCIEGQIKIICEKFPLAWKLLLICSYFDNYVGTTEEALKYISEYSNIDLEEGLHKLLQYCLVNYNDEKRYTLLPIVQGYILHLLLNDKNLIIEREYLVKRWVNWYTNFIEQHCDCINLDLYIEKRFKDIKIEYPNLLLAFRWCREQKLHRELLQLAEGMWFFSYLTGQLAEHKYI